MASIRLVSSTTIHLPERTERSRWELTVTEVAMLPLHYIQKGLLFPKPSTAFDAVVQRLQTSLSHCLLHFPFLSGRLATDAETTIFVDCNDAGAQFVVAKADGLHVSDLMNAVDVPFIVRSFFPMDGAINYDGYSLPLAAVQLEIGTSKSMLIAQPLKALSLTRLYPTWLDLGPSLGLSHVVTELEDGVIIGCSLNHATADGESFWHFFNSWSELNAGRETMSRPPLMERDQIHKELGQVVNKHGVEKKSNRALERGTQHYVVRHYSLHPRRRKRKLCYAALYILLCYIQSLYRHGREGR
ncbi:putative acetyltransferase [Nymphaea thermarum]|nr:putative acetyltransferase [Nymphaea thermarum]